MNLSVSKTLEDSVNSLVHHCHKASYDAGWWTSKGVDIRENPLTFSNKLMLTVSELAEAMEADRKNLMDDKLHHHKGTTVELADALIRICDLAGAYSLPLGQALSEKMAYNKVRPDHQLAARTASNGKAY